MEFITDFALGDDIAVLLIVLGVLAVAAIVLGALIPPRLAHHGAAIARRRAESREDTDEAEDEDGVAARAVGADEDPDDADEDIAPADEDDPDLLTEEDSDTGDPAIDRHLGSRLGSLVTSATVVATWVGVPAALLLLLVPGSTDVRVLRLGFFLVGLMAGPLAAWRASGMMMSAFGIAPSDRPRAISRFGGLFVASSLGIAALPIALALYFMHQAAASPLIAYAAGAAVFALALHAIASLAHTTGHAATMLVGSDENEIHAEDETNPGGPHLRLAQVLRRGPARSATLVALTAALTAASVRVSVPVFGAQGIGVTVLGLAVAIAVALAVAVFPHLGRAGRERTALRAGQLVPALLSVGGMVAGVALWLPSAYKGLRFDSVGLGQFTDKAITGSDKPVARSEIVGQIESAIGDMSQWISSTDESQYATTFLNTLTLYKTHPQVLAALAIASGAIITLAAQLIVSRVLNPHEATALRAARSSRTGGALGAVTVLGSAALATSGILALGGLVLAVVTVLAAGVTSLALSLVAFAGVGGLVVIAASSALHTSGAFADRPGTAEPWRAASRTGGAETAVGIQVASALAALPFLSTIVGAVAGADRAKTVWEDRALHALTPDSTAVLGGIALALITLVLIASTLLHGLRRLGVASVVETRTAILDQRESVDFVDLGTTSRRAALAPVAISALMPVVAGFAFGPSALPAYVGGLVLFALGAAVWSTISAGLGTASVRVIESGRYGGPGSWGHSGALGTTVLVGALRNALGSFVSMAALVGTLVGVLSVASMVNAMIDGTNEFLRWGVALIALLAIGASWVYAITAAQTDLEDELGETSKPLFARADEDEDDDGTDPLLMDWDDEDDESVAASPRSRRQKGSDRTTAGSGSAQSRGSKSGAGSGKGGRGKKKKKR
ncbi:pyrophosphatase [Brachybacterium endophyticum]|uniref:Pyrophosphatase n=1 Tax=Brachybacterium endophyticum TaxID=2182385 RepID=A0A2U2RL15_9MICO|nr:pyrophosphatase [Brachybacterium endophyticum]PWH06567.1 pyrophosphatase [Brachybacterium endophyticum]